MVDILTRAQRRFNMSRIRGQDTEPELMLRRGLHRRGLRYRLHRKDLPGRPDLVFPARKAVILVHGCFWHLHDCPKFKMAGDQGGVLADQDPAESRAGSGGAGGIAPSRMAGPDRVGVRVTWFWAPPSK